MRRAQRPEIGDLFFEKLEGWNECTFSNTNAVAINWKLHWKYTASMCLSIAIPSFHTPWGKAWAISPFFHPRYIVKNISWFSVASRWFVSFMHDCFRADNHRYTFNSQHLILVNRFLCVAGDWFWVWTLYGSSFVIWQSANHCSSLLFLTSESLKRLAYFAKKCPPPFGCSTGYMVGLWVTNP